MGRVNGHGLKCSLLYAGHLHNIGISFYDSKLTEAYVQKLSNIMLVSRIRCSSKYENLYIVVKYRCKISKSRDWYLESADCCDIWQKFRQICCRDDPQISKRTIV